MLLQRAGQAARLKKRASLKGGSLELRIAGSMKKI